MQAHKKHFIAHVVCLDGEKSIKSIDKYQYRLQASQEQPKTARKK